MEHPVKLLLDKIGYNVVKVLSQPKPYFMYSLSTTNDYVFRNIWNCDKVNAMEDIVAKLNKYNPLWYTDVIEKKPTINKGINLVNDYLRYNSPRLDNIINDPAQTITFKENNKSFLNVYDSTYYLNEEVKSNLKEGDWTHIRELIWHLCQENEEYFGWVINWFTCLYQFPTYRFTTSIIFIGTQGSGKGLLSTILSYLLSNVCYKANSKDLQSNFNAQLFEGKILLLANEIRDMHNKYQFSNDLKDFVTEKEISVEKKYGNRYNAKNYMKLILFSNSSQPISIDEDDRRYMVVKQSKVVQKIIDGNVLDKLFNDTDFLKQQVESFAYFLQNNLVNLNLVVTNPPMTEAKRNIIVMNMTDFKHVVLNILEEDIHRWKLIPVSNKWYYLLEDILIIYNTKVQDREIHLKKLVPNKFSKKLSSEMFITERMQIDSIRGTWVEIPADLVEKHKKVREVDSDVQ